MTTAVDAVDCEDDRIADATGVTTLTYDTRNLLESLTNPDGQTVTYRYNALRQRTGMTDPAGGRTTYGYDSSDRLVGITNPQGKRTTLAYDAKGRRVQTEHGNGELTTQVYDCADRVTHIRKTSSCRYLRLRLPLSRACERFAWASEEATGRSRCRGRGDHRWHQLFRLGLMQCTFCDSLRPARSDSINKSIIRTITPPVLGIRPGFADGLASNVVCHVPPAITGTESPTVPFARWPAVRWRQDKPSRWSVSEARGCDQEPKHVGNTGEWTERHCHVAGRSARPDRRSNATANAYGCQLTHCAC
jgi:YD repeat-containing protein